MKKALSLLLPILFSVNLAFAGGPQTISDWLGMTQVQNVTTESLISYYKAIIDIANKKIIELQNKSAGQYTGQVETVYKCNDGSVGFGSCPEFNSANNINNQSKNLQIVSDYLSSGCHKLKGSMWENMPKSVGSERDLNFFLISKGYMQATDNLFSLAGGEAPILLWGQGTTEAVKKFQSANGIKPTGSVGPQTLAKINSMICGSAQTTSSLPIIFTPTNDVTVISNNMTFSLDWKLSQDVLNKGYNMSKLYVILELVDSNNVLITSIGDGWAQNYKPKNYPLLHTWDKLPVGKFKINARLSYQPTPSGCDPKIKGECAPTYSDSDQKLIDYAKNLPQVQTNIINFAE